MFKTTKYLKGEIIITQGEVSDFAYYLEQGCLEVLMDTDDGQQCVIAEINAGEFFGEMGMISEQPRAATIRAKTDASIDIFDTMTFRQGVLGNEARRNKYLAHLFDRLRTSNGLLQAMAGKTGSDPFYTLNNTASGPAEPSSESVTEYDTLHLQTENALESEKAPFDITIEQLPYNIGRSSDNTALFENDLYLENKAPYIVSRNHCAIEHRAGRLVVRDRFSVGGTRVNGVRIGANTSNYLAELKQGDNEIILGASKDSPFKFTLTVS